MIETLIVDDEPAARDALASLLALYAPQVRVIGKCKSVAEAEEFIEESPPQLVFLDIVMPKSYGFDLLKTISDRNIQVIFTTAHNNFALRAFRTAAIDYLLKPITPEELVAAVYRATEQHSLRNAKIQLEVLSQNLKGDDNQLALPTSDGYMILRLSEIMYLEADSNYTTLHLTNGEKEIVAKTLGEFVEPFEGYPLVRVHRSYMVHLKHVRKVAKGNFVLMENGDLVPMSPGRKDDFMDQFLSMK